MACKCIIFGHHIHSPIFIPEYGYSTRVSQEWRVQLPSAHMCTLLTYKDLVLESPGSMWWECESMKYEHITPVFHFHFLHCLSSLPPHTPVYPWQCPPHLKELPTPQASTWHANRLHPPTKRDYGVPFCPSLSVECPSWPSKGTTDCW